MPECALLLVATGKDGINEWNNTENIQPQFPFSSTAQFVNFTNCGKSRKTKDYKLLKAANLFLSCILYV